MIVFLVVIYPVVTLGEQLKDEQLKFQWNRFHYPIERYASIDAGIIADTIVALQRSTGGWGKGVPPDKNYSAIEMAAIIAAQQSFSLMYDRLITTGVYSHKATTLDNGATHDHIRFLLRAAEATKNRKYEDAVLKGIKYLLMAQTTTGGWTQNYPNLSSYGGYVTFNDGAMVGAMTALQEAANGQYHFISDKLKKMSKEAVEQGVEFILKSQIVIDGKRTAWCAQHNKNNYLPEGGRIYELPSISGLESVGVVRLLMRISDPDERIKLSIISAIKWLESVKIDNINITRVYDNKYEASFKMMIQEDPASGSEKEYSILGKGYDKVVMPAKGRPIWARFYDLETQQPFFVGWDGIKRYSLDKIDYERRIGYLWYGYWPENLIKNNWSKWKNKWLSQ